MALGSAFYFLVSSFFSFVTSILTMRLMLFYLSKNTRNRISMTIDHALAPVLKPLRTVLPTVHRFDLALFSLLYGCLLFQLFFFYLFFNTVFAVPMVFIWAFFMLIQQALDLVFYSILGITLLSWLSPHMRNDLTDILFYLSDWFLSPIRRHLPLFSGIDLSPFIAIIGIKFIEIAFIYPFVI